MFRLILITSGSGERHTLTEANSVEELDKFVDQMDEEFGKWQELGFPSGEQTEVRKLLNLWEGADLEIHNLETGDVDDRRYNEGF